MAGERRPGVLVRRLRLASQLVFLLAFVGVVLVAGARRSEGPLEVALQLSPLAGVVTALSTRTLYAGLALGLLVLVPTFFVGRFFCGWVCPLGTLLHAMSSVRSATKRGARLIALNRYAPWQATKYYLLAAGLVAALFGAGLVGVLDPLSLLARSLTLSVFPATGYALAALRDTLHATGVRGAELAAAAVQLAFGGTLIELRSPHFRQAAVVGLVFAGLLLANLRVTRFWCRALCPLGALLGLASRYSLLRLEKTAAGCDGCNRCLQHCQGGDDPVPGAPWRRAECHLCMNCVQACPGGQVRFAWGETNATTLPGPDVARRRLLGHAVAGAVAVPLMRSGVGAASEAAPGLIRPPGALAEADLLARCIRCAACMRVCPTHALHPAVGEGGLEAFWTPVLVPRSGFCEPTCVLCSDVCPTGALWALTPQEKAGAKPGSAGPGAPAGPVKIGTAFVDRGRCLPWGMATECIVCEEWCPTSPKAIFLESAEVTDSRGEPKLVRQPRVDPGRCTGCGACEYACPVRGRAAITVSSVGETRSASNQLVLRKKEARRALVALRRRRKR